MFIGHRERSWSLSTNQVNQFEHSPNHFHSSVGRSPDSLNLLLRYPLKSDSVRLRGRRAVGVPWPLFGILPKIARHGRHHKGLEPEADGGPTNIHKNKHLHSVGLSLTDSEAAIPMISEVHHVVYHRLWFTSKARIIASQCLEVTGPASECLICCPNFRSLRSSDIFFSPGRCRASRRAIAKASCSSSSNASAYDAAWL